MYSDVLQVQAPVNAGFSLKEVLQLALYNLSIEHHGVAITGISEPVMMPTYDSILVSYTYS